MFVTLIFGGFSGFKFEDTNIQLHDLYLEVPILYLLIITFLWLTLLTIGVREIKYKYKRKLPIIILIINTSLIILATGFFTYALYAALVVSAIFDLFNESQQAQNQSPILLNIEWIGITLMLILATWEFFLVLQLRKINRAKNS
jgi:hypothetical protein